MKLSKKILIIAALLLTTSCALAQPSFQGKNTARPICKGGETVAIVVETNHIGISLFRLPANVCKGKPDANIDMDQFEVPKPKEPLQRNGIFL